MMKRLISLALAMTLVFGLAVTARAAGRITGIKMKIDTNQSYDVDTVYAQDKKILEFPLTANMFDWDDNTAGAANAPVTRSQLNSGNITVRTSSLDSSIIEEISIKEKAFSKTGNQKTAYVYVKFADEYVGTSNKNFKTSVYLAKGTNRSESSRIVLEGTYGNRVKDVDTDTDYADLSDGSVLKPGGYIKEIELYLGEGVILTTRVYGDRRYYGVAERKITSADSAMLDKYDIDDILVLNTVNLKGSGKIVSLADGFSDYHVYNSAGAYLGSSNNPVEYSDKYYLCKKQIDMGGGVVSSSSSSSSSSTSSTSSSASSTASSSGSSTPAANKGNITVESARTQTQTAINTAKASGQGTATVRVLDTGSVSASALKAMTQTASGSGVGVKLVADTMSGKAVSGRITINPALAANLTNDTNLGVYVDSGNTSATKTKFSKWFRNNIQVVTLGHKGSYGMTVQIAAKVSVSGMNTQNLVFYSYNSTTNQYTRITSPSYSVDANGYLHFSTTLGGDIIISEGELSRS